MSLTIPSVSFPDRWSFFNTIETFKPGLILTRLYHSYCRLHVFYHHILISYGHQARGEMGYCTLSQQPVTLLTMIIPLTVGEAILKEVPFQHPRLSTWRSTRQENARMITYEDQWTHWGSAKPRFAPSSLVGNTQKVTFSHLVTTEFHTACY